MGGIGGGGAKGAKSAGSAPMYIPPVTPPPEYKYEDTAALEEEANKQHKQIMAMKGRQSTILTGGQYNEDVTVGKRQLLGA